jgi:uncharacterized protein
MFGFVTGASSGVGEAFACRLGADGWDLAITARRGDRLRALARRLADEHGVRVQTYVADLTDPGDLAELEHVIAAAGPDLLVNNAGFAWYREFCEGNPAVVCDLVAVHVMAVTRLARAAVPAMVMRGSGAIINVASLTAFSGSLPSHPLPHRAVYSAAKAFQITFTQALAAELAGTGVQVQACCPGLVDTEFHALAGRDLTGSRSPSCGLMRWPAHPWRGCASASSSASPAPPSYASTSASRERSPACRPSGKPGAANPLPARARPLTAPRSAAPQVDRSLPGAGSRSRRPAGRTRSCHPPAARRLSAGASRSSSPVWASRAKRSGTPQCSGAGRPGRLPRARRRIRLDTQRLRALGGRHPPAQPHDTRPPRPSLSNPAGGHGESAGPATVVAGPADGRH